MSPIEIAGRLKLNEIRGRSWNIIATCATTGDGLDKWIHWMRDLSQKRNMGAVVLNDAKATEVSYAKHQLNIADETWKAWLERIDTPVEDFLSLAQKHELDL